MEKQNNSSTEHNRSVPTLRFPEFEGGWVINKLLKVSTKIGDGLHGTPIYQENTGIHFINGNNLIDGKIFITENTREVSSEVRFKNEKGLTKNTLLISINGTIGSVARYNDERVMLGKSVGYFIFENDCSFYLHLLNTNSIQNHFISELTGTTIKNLSLKTLRETEIYYPSLPEQTKIASFLSAVDTKINQLKQKKSLLEQYKKGIMQKIFNQVIRFKDEKSDEFPKWEKLKFGKLYIFKSTNSFSREHLNYDSGKVKNIHYGDIHTKFNLLLDSNKETIPFLNSNIDISNIPNENYCKKGDLIIVDASEDYNDIGKALEVFNLNNDKVIAGLHTILAKPDLNRIAYCFGAYLMKAAYVHKQIMKIAQGTKVLSISSSRLSEIDVFLPSISEQTKIANFLSAIDNKINLCTSQLDKMELWKKGLLQKMFV